MKLCNKKCYIIGKNKMGKHIFILALWCLLILRQAYSNYIIAANSTSSQVNASGNMTISIKTITAVTSLDVLVPNLFGIVNPVCAINSAASSCNKITPPTGANLIVRFVFNFSANANYTLTFNYTNPPYADSFLIKAFNVNGNVSFLNDALFTVNSVSIICSMTSSSVVVSQSANATFFIGVSTLPSGTNGSLSISVNEQTVFPNVFNAAPVCMSDNTTYDCSNSIAFSVQRLTVDSINVGARTNGTRLPLVINSIRNPPFNSTFENITIKVQNSIGKQVQSCTLQQPAPTTLQQSSSFVLQGWGSLVGQVSNVQFLLTPVFIPLENIVIKLVYQNQLIITPKAPASYTVTNGPNMTSLLITNATYSSQILTFNATVQNPSSTVPLSMISYILYNSTLFREQKSLATGALSLQKQTASVGATVQNSVTLISTTINITITSPIKIDKEIIINIDVTYGSFICSGLSLGSNFNSLTLTIVSCNQTRLTIKSSSSVSASSLFWFSAGYITHTSTIPNPVTITVTSIDNYAIMSGFTNLSLSVSQPLFIVTSSNSTYTALSDYTFIESNVTALNMNVVRVVTIKPPLYCKINDNSIVVSVSNSSIVLNYNIDLSGNTAVVTVSGKIQIKLKSVTNPSHYLGSRTWSLTATDTGSYSSSQSSAIHTPQYSPATSSITVSLSNQTIQQISNITLTFQPLLQYNLSNAPVISCQFSASSINRISNNLCPSCSLLTSTKFTFNYYSVVMRPIIQIVNNKDPNNNIVSFTISIDGFVYQTGQVAYTLSPLQYQFVAQFKGQFSNLGSLQIKIVSVLSTQLTVNYSGTSAIFASNQQCIQCNSTYLFITGIVGYFQTKDVLVQGYSNGILYAQGVVRISYTCSAIVGCQICDNVNSTFMCLRCFSKQFTNIYLLFQGKCYSACPAMTFQDGASCSPCQQLCYRCNSTACLQCVPGYYIYEGSCVQQCPPLYIKNSTHCLPRPIVCPTNCIDCPSDNVCNKCDAGYFLLQNLCYSKCPTNYIQNEQSSICKLFLPPQQTKYFPFAFFIASVIALIILWVMKRVEVRSLIIGNLVAVVSFLQIGALIMMISYTFISIRDQPDRWTSTNKLVMQGLLFLILVTKVIINVIFLAYFLRKISKDENFEKWQQKSQQNRKLYIILLVLSSVFSFQIMRIIYCRFMGLELFFGRFNTSLIFKPMNFFSLAYLIPGVALIVMAIFNIHMQGVYRTSIYYSSIEVIMMQFIIFACSLFEACRSDKEYFDYQLYKIQNSSQQGHDQSKIKIMEQQECGGSFNQMLIAKDQSKIKKPIGLDPDEVGSQTAGKILRNKCWRQKKLIKQDASLISPSHQQIIAQLNQNQQSQHNHNQIHSQIEGGNSVLKLSSMIGNDKNKEKSIFRHKILEDWQKLKNKMPSVNTPLFKRSNSKFNISKSPNKKASPPKLAKNASLQKIQKVQIRSPLPTFKNKSQLKNHFYKINKETTVMSKQMAEKQADEKQKYSISASEERTLEINNENYKNIHNLAENQDIDEARNGQNGNEQKNGANEFFDQQFQKQEGEDISQIPNNENEESFQKSLIQLKKNIKVNRYDDFDNQVIHQDEEDKQQGSKNMLAQKSQGEQFVGNRKKWKKRNVNKQTEAVYLQRLVSSASEMQRTKGVRRQKLQDF